MAVERGVYGYGITVLFGFCSVKLLQSSNSIKKKKRHKKGGQKTAEKE